MARLEQAVKNIVELFVEYADGDGQLSMEEFKKLFEKEIQNPEMKAKMSVADINKAMGRLDQDSNGAIDFRDFLKGVCVMCKCGYHKRTGRGQECED
ncbi:uncharacterized protein V6R79_021330 [Siganus canaliculatus]